MCYRTSGHLERVRCRAAPRNDRDRDGRILGQEERRTRLGGIGRFPARADAGGAAHRAAPDQGADRDNRSARRHPPCRLLPRSRSGEPRLARHIDSMGSVQALGFVAPMTYFIFIILSTLRLDFWLSTFTGFVAATALFCMAMFYHPAGGTDPEPNLYYHAARSLIVLICGMLAGAVGVQLRRQFEASITAATARDRITNLFGQHVSPQVVERLIAEGASTNSDIR